MHNRNLKYETHARAAGQQRDDGIAGAIHVVWTQFGKLDATTAWGIMILPHGLSKIWGELQSYDALPKAAWDAWKHKQMLSLKGER